MKKVSLSAFGYLGWGVLFLILLSLGAERLKSQGYGLSYEISPSMPEGVYFTYPATHLARGDIVIFTPPEAVESYLVAKSWIVPHVALMKYVRGVPGDEVCIREARLWINEEAVATVATEYAPGKPLPQLALCRTLGPDEYMLISTRIANSFDSRYFGPIKRSAIIAKAKPI